MAKTDGRYKFDKVDYDTEVEATLNQISNNFQKIDDRLGKRGRVTKTLPVGTTVQTFDRAGLLDVRMRGRTLVNLLGNDGNLESVSGWRRESGYGSIALDASEKIYGNSALKITISGSWPNVVYERTTPITIQEGKYYLIAVESKGTGSSVHLTLRFGGLSNFVVEKRGSSYSSYAVTYETFSSEDLGGGSPSVYVRLWTNGTPDSGQYGLYDGLRLYEITASEKAYIDSLPTAEAQAYIAANYPYVDNMQSVRNPYVIASGGNLATSETYKFFHGAQDEEDFVLRSNVDGSVADVLNGGTITRRFKEIELDGTQDWIYIERGAGFKRVRTMINNVAEGEYIGGRMTSVAQVTKFDGSIVVGDRAQNKADTFAIENPGSATKGFFLCVSNTDSGWGANYTPTADEIKAYFNGWKMYRAGTGYGTSVPYNGEGQKGWFYRGSEDGSPQGMTTTLPTDVAPINAYWKPYRLQYELAQPVTVKAFSEGDVIVHEGDNQITVGAGVVVREGLTLKIVGGVYQLNEPTMADTWTLYRPEDFYEIYKTNVPSINEWSYWPIESAGRRMALDRTKYDASATYSATYFVLDKHLFGIPAPVDVTTSGTELDTIESLVEYVALLKREIDVLKRGE